MCNCYHKLKFSMLDKIQFLIRKTDKDSISKRKCTRSFLLSKSLPVQQVYLSNRWSSVDKSRRGDKRCLSFCTRFPITTREFTFVSHPKTQRCCKPWGHKTRFVIESRGVKYEQIVLLLNTELSLVSRLVSHFWRYKFVRQLWTVNETNQLLVH